MTCDVVLRNPESKEIEKVLAPNGEESVLYKHILKYLPETDRIDPFAKMASDENIIGDPGLKEERALAYWKLAHTQKVEKEYLDKNGEPIFPAVRKIFGLPTETTVQDEVRKITQGSLIKFLRQEKLIFWKDGSYQVSNERKADERASIVATNVQNLNRIKTMLSWFGIPDGVMYAKRIAGNIAVKFQPFTQSSTAIKKRSPSTTNALTLIDFLKERFPQLKIEFRSERQARNIYNDIQQRLPAEKRKEIDFARAKSFVHGGTVYLIQNRVDNETAVEEVLHPFVYTISENNKELFQELHAASVKGFPKLNEDVESNYTTAARFTKEDRQLELVTKALGRTFAKEYEKNEPTSIIKLLNKVIEWFSQLVKDFGAFIGGKDQTVINVSKLPSGINLTQIAQLLNTYDSQFLVDTNASLINYRVSTPEEAFIARVKEDANDLQKKIITDLYEIEKRSVLEEENHEYRSTVSGLPLYSTTKAIGGVFNDPDKKYEMNSLFGNAFDKIMRDIVLGRPFKDIKGEIENLDLALAERAYDQIKTVVISLQEDGSIVLPQLRTSDDGSGIGGTLDLFVIRPDGSQMIVDLKVSKDSVREEKYATLASATSEGSKLLGHKLTKRQRQGIQVGVYKRLMEVNGYYPDQTKTFHIWIDIDGKGADQVVKKFDVEGWEEHLPSENRALIEKIVPTKRQKDKLKQFRAELGMESTANQSGEVDEETRQSEPYQDAMDKLRVKLEDFSKKVHDNIDRMKMVRSIANLKPHQEAIQKLSALLTVMRESLSRGEADRAYGQFLKHAKEELTDLIAYLSNTSNATQKEYIQKALDADIYIKTYLGISNAPQLGLGNIYQNHMLGEVQDLLSRAQAQVNASLRAYVLQMLKSDSRRKNMDDVKWELLLKQHIEISKADLNLGDIDTSMDPLVAVAAKLYKEATLRSLDRSTQFKIKAEAMGNKLAKAFLGAIDFDMILEKAANNKYTGRIVQKIDGKFFNLRDEERHKLLNAEGKMMQYKPVYSNVEAKSEDIEYNKNLYNKRKGWREFNQPEILTGDEPKDGKFYKYSDEFKKVRLQFEKYIPPYIGEDGKQRPGRWVRDKGKENEEEGKRYKTYTEYVDYREKYYNYLPAFDMPVMNENNEFTGVLVRNGGSMWSVKSDYIEIREIAGNGTDMRSEKWRVLQKPENGPDRRTEQQKAMGEFYDFYVKEMGDGLEMLPIDIQKDMMGEMSRVKGNFIDHMKKTPAFFEEMAKRVTGWFDMRTYAKAAMYDDEGMPMGQLPLLYTGSLRNEKRVEGLQKKLEQIEADYKSKTIKRESYLELKKRTKEELWAAKNAPSADELERDMLKALIKFRQMTDNFDEMQNIEAPLLAVLKLLKERTYNRKSVATGKLKVDAEGKIVEIPGINSYTYKRFKEWMEMTFYNSSEMDKSKFEVIAKKLMKLTSLEAIGLNILGPIHNYLMARLNTSIETWGGLFYSRSAGLRASKAYTTEFIRGWLTSIGKKDGYYYKTKLPGSKYEALVNYFHIMRPAQSGDGSSGHSSPIITSYGYLLSECGEYAGQTKSGIAYLMHTMLTKKISSPGQTAETLSIYDAFDFDPETGKLTLKKGYEDALPEKMKHNITNYIWEMNKQIHGNYAWSDRMLIQKTTIGEMAAQFHKFIYPMFKARFQPYYYDENLGDIEGRYRTVAHFALYCYEAEGNLLQKISTAFKGMQEYEVKNMYRNAAELVLLLLSFSAFSVFKGLAEGRDKDDKWMKRFLNYLSWESSRESKEILFWVPVAGLKAEFDLIKNPFAMAGSYGKFADALTSSVGLALPPYDDSIYYKAGPYKGQIKAVKKVKDLIPFLKDINRFASFDQVSKFYVQ